MVSLVYLRRSGKYFVDRDDYDPAVIKIISKYIHRLDWGKVKSCLDTSEMTFEKILETLDKNEFFIPPSKILRFSPARVYIPVTLLAYYMHCPRLGLYKYHSLLEVHSLRTAVILYRGKKYHECIEEKMRNIMPGYPELALIISVSGQILFGIIDYLGMIRENGRSIIVVVEFKSGSRRPETEQIYMYQAGIYGYMASKVFKTPVVPVVVYRDIAVIYSPMRKDAIEQAVRDLVSGKDGVHRSGFCKYCVLKRYGVCNAEE